MVVLVLLAMQVARMSTARVALPASLWVGAIAIAVLSALQMALGGWVSTNYAVLACQGFPTCQGSWWPQMDFEHGFALLRELGAGKDGGSLPFAALTAIHYAHRLVAYALLLAMAAFAWRLHGAGLTRPWAWATGGIALWQLASGLSNVVLGWPLLGAVAHTAGAAAWVTLLALLLGSAKTVAEPAFRKMHALP
jgi:cytochrome c oxidase assembly protein subunit 15